MNRTIIVAILFFFGVVIGALFTWPKYQDFQQLSFEAKARFQELENKETYFADLVKVKTDLVELTLPLSKVEAALPLSPQFPLLYDFLQNVASLSGMSVKNIAASLEDRKEELLMRTIPVTLELSGSFGAIKELISRLHSASRIVTLQSVSISQGQDAQRFNVIIQLHTYSY
ncbi:MAG: type 4a pilus biogenesis protein PilO [bacterium]|nr:type 4a pilus biogenesis protein PilO [bacterium]